jgi:hypothetical protein
MELSYRCSAPATEAEKKTKPVAKTVALKERLIFFGKSSLRAAVQKFVAHYHTERNHQRLDNRLIQPDSVHLANMGTVQRRERLGGKLNYYYRAAA